MTKIGVFMNSRKKGALELSMNTIVIVVIGITLLVLGLAFVSGIFERLTGLSDTTFEEANSRLSQLSDRYDSFINLAPSNIDVQKDKRRAKGVYVILNNLGDTALNNLNVQLEVPQDSSNDISCKFSDGSTTKGVRPLGSGENEKLDVLVSAKSAAPLGTETCIVRVLNGPTNVDREGTIIVNLV